MSALVHCIYSSIQAATLSDADLAALVKHSRQSNAQRDVTGILLHVDTSFFQVLEGPEEIVRSLYSKILVDPRHHRITLIIFEPIARRYFGDSSMTLTTLSPDEFASVVHYGDSTRREALLTDLDEGRAKRLLRAFSDGRWRQRVGFNPPVVSAVQA